MEYGDEDFIAWMSVLIESEEEEDEGEEEEDDN